MVTAGYLVASALWITLSDHMVAALFADRVTAAQTYKGWVFILVTAALLLLVLWREDRRRRRVEDALRERTQAAQEAEAVMREAKEKAERAERAKARFLAAASHDLRQPLQGMFLFLETVSGAVEGERGLKALGHLKQSLDGLKSLLDSLLDLSRLENGRLQPQVADFPFAELATSLDAAYGPVAAGKGLGWRMSPACATAWVRSDPTLLGRMLRNLIENALRYTSEGEVRLECRAEGRVLRIEVQDTGVGIPAGQLEQIWEEFHQVGGAERDSAQGLGLGLAIVRRLAKLLGHEVQVRSEAGRGSVFSIDVPLAAPMPAAGEVPAGRQPALATAGPISGAPSP
jgi:signal transduction histidine kinase